MTPTRIIALFLLLLALLARADLAPVPLLSSASLAPAPRADGATLARQPRASGADGAQDRVSAHATAAGAAGEQQRVRDHRAQGETIAVSGDQPNVLDGSVSGSRPVAPRLLAQASPQPGTPTAVTPPPVRDSKPDAAVTPLLPPGAANLTAPVVPPIPIPACKCDRTFWATVIGMIGTSVIVPAVSLLFVHLAPPGNGQ